MAVYKSNQKWYIKGKIKKENGLFYYYHKLAVGCTLKKEAIEYERKFKKQYQDIQVSVGYVSFKKLSDEYINSLTSVKSVTKRTYSDLLDKINEVIGDKKINLINRDILQKYIRNLESKYAKEYVEKFYYILRATFNYAIENDYITVNPMNKVKLTVNKDEVRKEMDFWEPDEFNRFIENVEDQELHLLYTFLFYMGTRRGETLALQWKDIDFKNHSVSIYKTVTYKIKGKPWEITSPKTENSVRNIPMFKIVEEELLAWKKVCEQKYGFSEQCYVFGFSRPLAAERPRKKMVEIINKINDGLPADQQLKKIRIHDFRHSHASWLINNMGKFNFSDFDIAKRLGDTVQMLHSTYAHQFKDAGKNIIEAMETLNNDAPKALPDEQRNNNYISELKELKELLDMDIITQEEFNLKKRAILKID